MIQSLVQILSENVCVAEFIDKDTKWRNDPFLKNILKI